MRSKTEFWPFKIAKDLVKHFPDVEKQVISSGTSMSGEPHIGNANDVIRASAIFLACEKLGINAELNWVSDDMDPLRSIPQGMPPQLKNYLGFPVSSIPDFWGCHENFAKHYEEMFLEQLKEMLVEPVAYFGYEMYKKGMYNKTIEIAMEKRKEIIEILNKFRAKPLGEDWYPISVICQNCGKIATTKILSYDSQTKEAEYVCLAEEIILHRKYRVRGCGHKGKVSIFNGNAKLKWRIEWPARWSFLKVTCEGMGKEHATAGGSYDTGKEIVEKIFGWKAPYPFFYEHFLVEGQKMSKSKGNVITLPDMLRYLTPQQIRYWMFQGSLMIAKDIRLKEMTPRIIEEFDRAERVYFGKEKTRTEREKINLTKAYEIAVVKPPEKMPLQLPFSLAKLIASFIPPNKFDIAKEIIEKTLNKKVTPQDERLVKERLIKVRNWVEDFGEKIEFVKLSNDLIARLTEKEKEALSMVANKLKEDFREEELFEWVKEAASKSGISSKEAFKACYKVLIGREEGPRLYYLLKIFGKEKSYKRLKLLQ